MDKKTAAEYTRIAAATDMDRLIASYPDQWDAVNTEIITALKSGSMDALVSYMNALPGQAAQSGAGTDANAIAGLVKARMVRYALDKLYLALATGQKTGKVRFSLLNGYILQKLLFYHDFDRKPVNLRLFRLVWPFITQKQILMPLVSRKGIYCFYSELFISELTRMIGDRDCLEIAAGDGTLAGFLRRAGAAVRATDDYSWSRQIVYADSVEKLDARSALQRYRPEVVICSWPPPVNRFERYVFETRSVHTYIVIGSRHRFASGDREAYERQHAFAIIPDKKLAGLIVPRENDNEVLIFNRK